MRASPRVHCGSLLLLTCTKCTVLKAASEAAALAPELRARICAEYQSRLARTRTRSPAAAAEASQCLIMHRCKCARLLSDALCGDARLVGKLMDRMDRPGLAKSACTPALVSIGMLQRSPRCRSNRDPVSNMASKQ